MKQCGSDYYDIAAIHKAAGDVLRLQILRVLAEDAYGVLELCQIFDYRQSSMSHHLKVLAEVGLVSKRREGNSIFYSRGLSLGEAEGMRMPLFNSVDNLALPVEVEKRVLEVKCDRAAQSQTFFEQHSDSIKKQQDLIADYSTYGDTVAGMLLKAKVPANNYAIEIGPGQGEFLPIMAKHFTKVMALDNAPVMLEASKQFCKENACENIEFVCRDTSYFQDDSFQMAGQVDCLVMNMVLHHTPSPADIFQDIVRALKPKGVFLMTDLCRHNQDWAKTACGDLWMGFDPDELNHWGQLAGLKNIRGHYFALRNGFQVQIQQFIKNS